MFATFYTLIKCNDSFINDINLLESEMDKYRSLLQRTKDVVGNLTPTFDLFAKQLNQIREDIRDKLTNDIRRSVQNKNIEKADQGIESLISIFEYMQKDLKMIKSTEFPKSLKNYDLIVKTFDMVSENLKNDKVDGFVSNWGEIIKTLLEEIENVKIDENDVDMIKKINMLYEEAQKTLENDEMIKDTTDVVLLINRMHNVLGNDLSRSIMVVSTINSLSHWMQLVEMHAYQVISYVVSSEENISNDKHNHKNLLMKTRALKRVCANIASILYPQNSEMEKLSVTVGNLSNKLYPNMSNFQQILWAHDGKIDLTRPHGKRYHVLSRV